ncbi:MAG: XRE family transcriptional regulator [Gemmatimonadaceae bacterium]
MPINDADFNTPGQLISALLQEKAWSTRILAVVLGVEPTGMGRILRDSKAVDATMAIGLSEVFNIPAERFLELQRNFDLAKARLTVRPDPNRARRAQLLGDLPVAEMATRGWIDVENVRDVPKIESELAKFFGAPSAEILAHAAKRTNVSEDATPVQLAWLYRVRQIASEMVVPSYGSDEMQAAIKKLSGLLASVEEARKAPRILAEAGVRFVVVESLTSAKIDGACFWLDDRSPVIGLSLRYDRIDNFWFVLRHECEHVLRGHGRQIVSIDTELEKERAGTGVGVAEDERVANEAAADFCVPASIMRQFVARKAPIFTERDILGFAKTVNVHPGLVAGQLQHITARYDRFRAHQAKVRSVVLPNVIHDGWGDVAPVGQSYSET